MLVYEKYVEEDNTKVRHLYGTLANEPSDNDNQLVYKDSEGNIITDLNLDDLYLDDKHGGIIVITKDGSHIHISVDIEDTNGNLVKIIPYNKQTFALVGYAIVDTSTI